MADQICYAVLCVFSYVAAGSEKRLQHSKSVGQTTSLVTSSTVATATTTTGPIPTTTVTCPASDQTGDQRSERPDVSVSSEEHQKPSVESQQKNTRSNQYVEEKDIQTSSPQRSGIKSEQSMDMAKQTHELKPAEIAEPGSVTPTGGPPSYPPPELPAGVQPPAPPPGLRPLRPPPIPSRVIPPQPPPRPQ